MVSVSEIAQEAGVSLATASRALRECGNIRTEKQKNVIDAARRLGYHFNFDNQKNGKTRQILFLSMANVLPLDVLHCNTVYSSIIDGINRVLVANGYNLLLAHMEENDAPPVCLIRKEVDGVIFHGNIEPEFFHKYMTGIPAVGLQHYVPDFDCSWVKIDNGSIAFQAVRHLWENGHRRLAFLSNEGDSMHSRERQDGFRNALRHFGLEARPEWEIVWQREVINNSPQNEKGLPDFLPYLEKVFQADVRPTAIFCLDMFRAKWSAHALRRIGLNVPDDVSLIGSITRHCLPPQEVNWTLVDDRFRDVCEVAARMLLDTLQRPEIALQTTLLRPVLYPGDSVKKMI